MRDFAFEFVNGSGFIFSLSGIATLLLRSYCCPFFLAVLTYLHCVIKYEDTAHECRSTDSEADDWRLRERWRIEVS